MNPALLLKRCLLTLSFVFLFVLTGCQKENQEVINSPFGRIFSNCTVSGELKYVSEHGPDARVYEIRNPQIILNEDDKEAREILASILNSDPEKPAVITTVIYEEDYDRLGERAENWHMTLGWYKNTKNFLGMYQVLFPEKTASHSHKLCGTDECN